MFGEKLRQGLFSGKSKPNKLFYGGRTAIALFFLSLSKLFPGNDPASDQQFCNSGFHLENLSTCKNY